jgi:hypothetical protein
VPTTKDTLERLGRAGLVARGCNYVIVGWLALLIATGDQTQEADRQGAVAAVARQPFGEWLVIALVVGLAGYAAWRLAEAITGHTSSDADAGTFKRIGAAAKAALYAGFAVSTLGILLRGQKGNGGDQQRTWTARVLDWPLGRPAVVAAGIIVIGAGLFNIWRGIAQRFADRLKEHELHGASEPAVRVLGTAGHLGRGVAFALVGSFVVQAALTHDPDRSRGLDGALHTLVARSYGPPLLVAVALGLALFGAYSLAEARWRRVLGR